MPVLWKGQNCQVAEKCIYTTFKINIFLDQKSFINNNIANKIKCMYWFNYKIVIGSQRKTMLTELLHKSNELNNFLHMKAIIMHA